MWRDLRYGLRGLVRNPGFAAVALVTLALGIGANTAIFSIVNALLIRPLSYEDPEHLVLLWERQPSGYSNPISDATFADWIRENKSFSAMAAIAEMSVNISGGTQPEQVQAQAVSADFFDILGQRPAIGRTFSSDVGRSGFTTVVVLGNRLWKTRFAGRNDIVGQQVNIDGISHTIVGVMPENFQFRCRECQLYYPLPLDPQKLTRRSHYLVGLARLKEGVTVDAAIEEMNALARRIGEAFPETNRNWGVLVRPLRDGLVSSRSNELLWILFGAVALVLLIACVNVANLMLSRASGLRREIAVRTALGAGRGRIIRQLLTESLLLALCGGGLGLLVSQWGVWALLQLMPDISPAGFIVTVDHRVLFFALMASVLSAVIFGLIPAFQAAKIDLSSALKEGSRNSSGGRATSRTGRLLVAAEIALAVPLVIACGLLVRTIGYLYSADAGFDPGNVITAEIPLTSARYANPENVLQFQTDLLERVRAVPGVKSADLVTTLPLDGMNYTHGFKVTGREPGPNDAGATNYQVISPGYFGSLGIRLLRGRTFSEHDNSKSEPVIIISENIAKRFFQDEDPIGRRISISSPLVGSHQMGPVVPRQIVGVAADVHDDIDQTEYTNPALYLPYLQAPYADQFLVVKTLQSGGAVMDSVRRAVLSVDPDQAMASFRNMNQVIRASATPWRREAQLFGAFALLAMALAVVGIYGVISYSVSRRRNEIGIRMALGAEPGRIVRLIVADGLRLALCGIGVGLVGALGLTRLIASLLFGVTANDPLTFVVVGMILCLVSVVACYLPSRQATRVDPMIALRCE
jgi:putative ABC transport system permease protein